MKPSKVLWEWTAPERLFQQRSREYYRKIAVIIIFFALLLLIIKEFLLIAVLGVIFFVVYVFHTIPPQKVTHQITTHGINYASQHLYRWDELVSFFIEKREDTNILSVNTKEALPGRLFLLLSDETDPKKISEIMNQYLSIVENPEVTVLDKITKAISSRVKL